MAAETAYYSLTKDDWTLLAQDKKVVAIQLLNPASVRIHIGDTSVPPTATTAPGIVIARGLPELANAWSAAGLPEGTGVWAISMRDPVEDVVVMSY